jgi:hypothetical protein
LQLTHEVYSTGTSLSVPLRTRKKCSFWHRPATLDALIYFVSLILRCAQPQVAIESKVKIIAKSRMAVILIFVLLAVPSALLAQTGASIPRNSQSHASVLDAHRIVEQSVLATERSWRVRDHYTYMELGQDRRLDSSGQIESEDVDVTSMILVNGARFEQLIKHNGQPPSAEQQTQRDEDLDKLEHATPEEKAEQLRKDQDNRAFLRDVLEAFDFQLLGEEMIEGRPAYLLQATPHPGYHVHGKYGKLISKVQGKLWVDKQDFAWVRVDGQVTQSFTMGLFVARVQRGSHIILEQTCVGDAVWLPRRVELRASAKIFFLKNLDIDKILTYSDYRLAPDSTYSADK